MKKISKKYKATKSGKVTLNFKVPPERAAQIRSMADRFTKGNVTALLQAGLRYVPMHAKEIKEKMYRSTTRN